VYLGELGGLDNLDFLGDAMALLNPIRWPEPFGLVMIGALAVGTPVVSFPEGAAPEIVRPGLNGFLCEDEDEMTHSIGRVDELDRGTCRASVEGSFSVARLVADQVMLYRRAIADWDPGAAS